MITRPRVALTLLAALLALVLPASASAVVYEVNTTADEADKAPGAPCETNAGAGVCTLRAAIEVANSTIGVPDEITFAANPFNGENGDTISAATQMPTITDQVSIRGGRCDTLAGVKGPCAGVIKAGGGFLLQVEDDDVEIRELALSGALIAINVINASERFVAKGNWIGFDVTGSGSSNATGIFIDPDSDGATIGGTTEADRNVFGFSVQIGLDLEGASGATIQGNYFGVTPKGDAAAAQPTNIEITDSTSSGGFAAENNEVGNTIEGAALTSATCDGGCNVISGATGTGIDLNGSGLGEKPASGPTTIHGNFVGLGASGTTVIANSTWGIQAGAADDVKIGDFSPGDANYLAGGGEAIFSANGEALIVRGNKIGFGSDGSKVTPPALGVFVLGQSVSAASSIESNAVRASNIGIEHRGLAGHITGNDIEGGNVGIWEKAEPGGGLIASNTVEAAGEYGIVVESPDNGIRANTVVGSGLSGIRVKNPKGIQMDGNLIGGNTKETENTIEGSGGPAIEIFEEAEEPGSTTEIGRNHGSGNKGLFIDLKAGANEGIVSPAFSTATQSKAEGTADPETKIRVFRKASGEAGELQSFLAETVADASGNWKVTYPSIPTGTIVAATQTNVNGGTSELSTATASADPSDPCKDGLPAAQCAAPTLPPPPPTLDTTAPTAKITKAPKAKSASTTAKFKFNSNEGGSKFQCKLDKGKFKTCKSPKTYKKLKVGKHVFKVRATDKAGNVGKPAKRKFTVLAG